MAWISAQGTELVLTQPPSVHLLNEFCFSRSYNPFDGPNENPEAELPLTAGKYLYVYGDMDEDGFYEGVLNVVVGRCTWLVPVPG